jgi:hypothetical protein
MSGRGRGEVEFKLSRREDEAFLLPFSEENDDEGRDGFILLWYFWVAFAGLVGKEIIPPT